ncbi:TPA: SRPBCC family protein [Kluyvera ascorbata]|nr:SRPBCC family protein [Kluyvera ascorbata]
MSEHATDTRDLSISRLLNAPRALLWRAWTDPELLSQWWCPKPWTTEVLAFDLRPGGEFHTLMRGPDGESSDNPGCFLEIVPQERLVMTTMLTADWRPATTPFAMTVIVTFADEGSGCRYTARVLHPDDATREQHEQMGFYEGWNIVMTQLEAFANTLK